MTKDQKEQALKNLKAQAYDLLVLIQQRQKDLEGINRMIAETVQAPEEEG